ncbi:MAG: hypothetical protein AMDU3_IPLC00001G0394 [Thermoplasmatales archaeon I-plasma]|jgi:hypothetical protein|nr:MAG: hypothetical protein AMDU3_IPLC00001G0394 [Thermoplasmatales archaeon I-plasma]MCL4450064.1 hypothetical protein [Candidatus Thermoplasmatota archaeon]MCL5930021.1 hypothetical protein [Candidatus Thermoplasmatota archaeon]
MDVYKIPVAKKPDMEKILSMDQVFRLSITIKDSSILGEEGFQYLILEGTEDRLKVAREELSKISEKLDPDKARKVQELIEKERQNVNDSFGSIFG